jgi:hypothetical protein
MNCLVRLAAVAAVFASAGPASLAAQEPAPTAQEPSPADARMEAMTTRASLLKMAFAELPDRPAPELLKSAVLRASDPTRDEIDGAVWLWLDGKRPAAALCLLSYPTGKWNYEHVALCDEALAVTGRRTWSWRPKPAARPWTRLPDPVPPTARAQQSALRGIARRLEATESRRGETFALRLLDRPIYTYADPDRGIVQGGLFAMSYGTNPELLVQVEARTEGDKPHWQIAFARLSAAELIVRQSDKEIWRADALKADDPTGSYYGVNELPTDE